MADGSRTVEVEANAAAAEAAREAKAEVLRRTSKSAAPPASAKSEKPSRRGKPEFTEFAVDIWITNLNWTEFGIYKHKRNQAKSRQFTTDMDIFAEVIEDGERSGLIGYREDLWKHNTGMDKRLVFKLFTDSLNWRATMDLMLGRSIQLTLGARGLPVWAFSMNTGDHEQMIYLERSANKWPLLPENYSFFLLDDGKPSFYRLRRDFIDLGGDYTLYNQRNENIGKLDGRVLSIGGYWKGSVKTEYADPRLLVVLKLFCGMSIFGGDLRRHLKSLVRDISRGKLSPKLEKQEADLYMNPRRVR
jgi:hypothetical protein